MTSSAKGVLTNEWSREPTIEPVELVEPVAALPLALQPSPAWIGWQARAKRAFDIVAATLLLILLSPLLALLALIIRLDSKGPVIFRQTRCGKDGKLFIFYKFRGMVADAEARQAEFDHLNEAQGPIFKMKHDPRVTRVGRVLRRTSLDELPQLWNVLRGEMSLVGPRPPLPKEVERYEAWHQARLRAVPGITGLWQVSGRSHLGFDEMTRLDIEYLNVWSLALDLRILVRTVVAVVFAHGAY
jgi:exopolysaccharide biosynthesis polyprenyl glycosylphosphotransferase